MTYYIKTEEDRMKSAISFAKAKIEELERDISECDYIEDVNGKLVRCSDSYPGERYELENEKEKWEIMLKILTFEAPCSILDW